jgi:HprK-related kinase A
MLIKQLPDKQFLSTLNSGHLAIAIGDFWFSLRSSIAALYSPLQQLYRDYPCSISASDTLCDARIGVEAKRNYFSRQARFIWEDSAPFPALPISQAHPLFEWGLNWAVATMAGQRIVIHSAVLERNGKALLLPGEPGSGKSTLCAALAFSGWRLLSDELSVINPMTHEVHPYPRPISLKNESIDIIARNFPSVYLTEPISDTRKGSIAYARPDEFAVAASYRPAPIGHVIFPKFSTNGAFEFTPMSRAQTLSKLLENTFNVGILGQTGFVGLATSLLEAQCYAFSYGSLEEALEGIAELCP